MLELLARKFKAYINYKHVITAVDADEWHGTFCLFFLMSVTGQLTA